MSTRMLIDARHEEETRVTIVRGNRVEEFDYESAHKAQIKGNIYLAKVTRVEPSLQAAFIEYGGNRHGFLAFSEIHPDYYQIPIEDREALLAEERAASARDEAEEESSEKPGKKGGRKSARKTKAEDTPEKSEKPEVPEDDGGPITDKEDDLAGVTAPDDTGKKKGAKKSTKKSAKKSDPENDDTGEGDVAENGDEGGNGADTNADANTDAEDDEGTNDEEENGDSDSDETETTDEGEDEMAETIRQRRSMRSLKRRYKIQEVIKRRQILLVQVVKEERGTKGAALTTYLSLAGRYCVVMPNSTSGGGVSRKISNSADRRKLKSILSSLNGPQGIGCIIRTAGLQRTKAEIKRDYDYLVRLWEDIRSLTLKSVAPALIYEEGNLIKRSIRDLYNSSIDEVLVEGEEAYKAAKALMKLLMPSHAKRVQHYDEKTPLFHRYQVEEQLDSMFNPTVTLKSGGYLVINPTEALISIDVNSGRSTKEHNIEETALKTNLEAADEVGRQLRLRDMAGLVVIDFIDMEYRGNNRKIERRLKDALKADRARIQVGRISQFGLMEMSRQRLRPNLVEASTITCRYCEGTGRSRTVESSALHVIRALEEEGIRERSTKISLKVPADVAVYVLNSKRDSLHEMEEKYGLQIDVLASDQLVAPHYELTRTGTSPDGGMVSETITDQPDASGKPARRRDSGQETSSGRGRSRRGRGRGRDDRSEAVAAPAAPAEGNAPASRAGGEDQREDGEERPRKRRRRGRRGGRRRRAAQAAQAEQGQVANAEAGAEAGTEAASVPASEASAAAGESPSGADAQSAQDSQAPETAAQADSKTEPKVAKEEAKKPARRGRKSPAEKAAEVTEKSGDAKADAKGDSKDSSEEKPKRTRRAAAKKADKEPKEDAGKAKAAPTARAKTEKSKAANKVEKKSEAKSAKKPDKAPARKATSKSDEPEAKPAVKPAKEAKPDTKSSSKAGNGIPAEMAAEPAKKAKSTGAAGAKAEKPKRGWWQRKSTSE